MPVPPFIIKAVISYLIPLVVETVVDLGESGRWDEIDEAVRVKLESAVHVPKPLRSMAFRVVDWMTDVAAAVLSDNHVVRDSIVALAKQDYLGACEVLREALFTRFLEDPSSPVEAADKASISAALAKAFGADEALVDGAK